MSGTGELISNVSDTARWVAAYRAQESRRGDALFSDPLADRLAGARGYEIAAAAPRMMQNGWPVVARTKLMDDLVMTSLAEGCDLVVNLAAGLDTRPYRLPLSTEFRWAEADLPDLVAEKSAALADAEPRCTLVRRGVDLADPAARRGFLDEILEGASRALVITEGLLMYLPPETVVELARDLARPTIAWWMADIARGVLERMRAGGSFANAPLLFEPSGGLTFFDEIGWNSVDVEPILAAARKFRRAPWFLVPFTFLPQPDPRGPVRGPWSAVVRMRYDG
ncbi:class I SAM-dependent methyltransferase [Nocardia terpenica]|uniref:S-adenosyl-L-methionine-dependent methyltransferase n=1 Tax=Nocardia terpenica TaxID=455432 RepID=A0A291RKG5_9NOCA|nr:class I SAM-dependent methyltransferase [Nocardia terpenica]ATL68063.1 SAM-dependent methyltransferase [Nocardia terpenica]